MPENISGDRQFPPFVFVPCGPTTPGAGTLSVDLRLTGANALALLVYSALDRLVDCCGERQPWVVLATADLETVRLETGFSLIFLDLDIPSALRRG